MKGIILAGGTGSRLYPLTKVTNKHCLAVGDKPMIFYAVEKLIEVNITDIMIVTGVEHIGSLVGLLGSGKDFQCNFTYRVQDQAGGIAQALALTKEFVNGDKSVVILGDNIFEDSLALPLSRFQKQSAGARLLLSKVTDPERFGVATLDGDKIIKITEKPEQPESLYAVTGIYFYDAQVFDFITRCQPSGRGELEITDVNNAYVESGQCDYDTLEGWWTDAGTFESLTRASNYLKGQSISE